MPNVKKMRKSIKLLYSVVKSTSNLDQIQTIVIFALTYWCEEKGLTGKRIRNFSIWLVRKDVSCFTKADEVSFVYNLRAELQVEPWRKTTKIIIKLNTYILAWEKNNFLVFLVWYKNSWKGMCISKIES